MILSIFTLILITIDCDIWFYNSVGLWSSTRGDTKKKKNSIKPILKTDGNSSCGKLHPLKCVKNNKRWK